MLSVRAERALKKCSEHDLKRTLRTQENRPLLMGRRYYPGTQSLAVMIPKSAPDGSKRSAEGPRRGLEGSSTGPKSGWVEAACIVRGAV